MTSLCASQRRCGIERNAVQHQQLRPLHQFSEMFSAPAV